jgi:hypothetical protein
MAATAAAAPAADVKRKWVTVYPVYINSVKTVADGRRLPKAACVHNPTLRELHDICQALKLPAEVEVRTSTRAAAARAAFARCRCNRLTC